MAVQRSWLSKTGPAKLVQQNYGLAETHSRLPYKREQEEEDGNNGQNIYQRIKNLIRFGQFCKQGGEEGHPAKDL